MNFSRDINTVLFYRKFHFVIIEAVNFSRDIIKTALCLRILYVMIMGAVQIFK